MIVDEVIALGLARISRHAFARNEHRYAFSAHAGEEVVAGKSFKIPSGEDPFSISDGDRVDSPVPIEVRIWLRPPMTHQELFGSLPVTFATTTPARGGAGWKGKLASAQAAKQ